MKIVKILHNFSLKCGRSGTYEARSKCKVTSPLGENFYSRIQRDTQYSNSLVHITSSHSHHGCQNIRSIGTPTYRNRYRRYQHQGCRVTSGRLAKLGHWFSNADLQVILQRSDEMEITGCEILNENFRTAHILICGVPA